MSSILNYEDLLAWQKAMDLTVRVYRLTEAFPRREWYGLAHQMRKSAVSVPSNIAEGHRQRRGAYVRHLWIALGSHGELSTQCDVAFRLQYLVDPEKDDLKRLLGEVGRLTRGLLKAVDNSSS
jgi:four helix bundle protein